MTADTNLKIAIAEPSVLIRSGLSVVLKRVQGFHVQTFEILSIEHLVKYISIHKPDFLVINPFYWGYINIPKIKEETNHSTLKVFAILNNLVDESMLKMFDEKIFVNDTLDDIQQKLEKACNMDNEISADDSPVLSQREKEIICCVVKGQINKEIAQTLFLSTHTVITHRRNIARKLGIHSTAGLTVYAIMNKLVDIEDIAK